MKYIWIIEKTTSKYIFYHSFTEQKVDGVLISGLLSAMNLFSESELGNLFPEGDEDSRKLNSKGIESIDMGGLKWVFATYPEEGLLLVAAGDKEMNASLMLARLHIIERTFMNQYHIKKEVLQTELLDHSIFQNFSEVLNSFNKQWNIADKVKNTGDLLDLLLIFQQIFSKFIKIINESINGTLYNEVLKKLNDFTPLFQAEQKDQENFRLIKLFFPHIDLKEMNIKYNQNEGTNFVGMNPVGLEIDTLKSMFLIVIINYKEVIRQAIGQEKWLMSFNREIRPFLFARWDFLNKLNLIQELLGIFLEDSS